MNIKQMTISQLAGYLESKEELSPREVALLKADGRLGAAALLERFNRRKKRAAAEENRLYKMLAEERTLWEQGFSAVAGTDEAGRGPLAGPVLAAAVILEPEAASITGLNDSKMLSREARERLFDQIVVTARCYAIASATCQEIDRLNIHAASLLAMRRALEKLALKPDFVLVDGFKIRDCLFRQKAITGGDGLSLSIAAASVLAKVARDKIMAEMHEKYPCYGFDRNKGYATFDHFEAIARHGPCPEHRRSFRLGE